jgi:acyl dehydratase
VGQRATQRAWWTPATSSASLRSAATVIPFITTRRSARDALGGIVVQGGVTTAILNAVVAEDLPGPGTVFLRVSWDFRAPVRPGDAITGEVVLTKVRDDKPITEMTTRVMLADGTVVLEGTAVCFTMPLP